MATIREDMRREQEGLRKMRKDQLLERKRQNFDKMHTEVSIDDMGSLCLNGAMSVSMKLDVLRRIAIGTSYGKEYIQAFYRDNHKQLSGIMNLLNCKHAELRLEAAVCLTNLSTDSHKLSLSIGRQTGNTLINFVFSGGRYLQDQCAWALGNVINDCVECYQVLKEKNVMLALKSLLKLSYPEVIESATYAIFACMKYEEIDPNISSDIELLGSLLNLLKQNWITHPSHVNAIFIIWQICLRHTHSDLMTFYGRIFEIVMNNLINAVNCENFDNKLATPCVRCLGTMTAVSDDICKTIACHESLQAISTKMMNCIYPYLQKEFLWVLCNVFASVPLTEIYLDLKMVLSWAKLSISPLDTKALQALLFVCIMIANNGETKEYVKCLMPQVEVLRSCGGELETAANTLISVMNQLPDDVTMCP